MPRQKWPHEFSYLARRLIGGDVGVLIYVADWSAWGVQRALGSPPRNECGLFTPQLAWLLRDHFLGDGFWHNPPHDDEAYAIAIDPSGLNYKERIGTLLHELAHVVCHHHHFAEQHGENWRRVCRGLQRQCPVRVTLEQIDPHTQWAENTTHFEPTAQHRPFV